MQQHKIEVEGRIRVRFHAPDIVLEEWEQSDRPEETSFYLLCAHVRTMIEERLKTLAEEGVELAEVTLELEWWSNLGVVDQLS